MVIFLLVTLTPNESSAQPFELPACDPKVELQAPCRLESGNKAPWAGALLLEDDLIKLEASLRTLEKTVEILEKGLAASEQMCRDSIDTLSKSYEERINGCFALFKDPPSPVIVQETEWWEFALWSAGGVTVGALLVGAIWLGVGIGSL